MKLFFKKNTLCFSVLAAILMVSIEVESWALALSTLLLIFRFGSEQKWWKNFSTLWVNIFSITSLCLVLAQFKTFLGQEASSTLLVMLASLRIADFKSDRDEKFLILLSFILVALKFLFSLDFFWFPIGGAIFLGLWRSLLAKDIKSPWKLTGYAALRSLPVVAILFFVFPRVQIPWARELGPLIPLSGMSESIGPGDISNLTLSQETAFRAHFVNFRPGMRDLYWRGAVLEEMNGFRWNKTNETTLEIPTTKEDIQFDYTVTLEPSNLRILPTLEHTRFISSPMITAVKTDRSIFKTNQIIGSRIQYKGLSTFSWNGKTIENPFQLSELPPQTQAWVTEVKLKKLNHIEKVQILKKFFLENNFSYTREPGTYANLDEFLFDRRLGFCEHFAGAYATLARALEIPARVITGYQGGEWNEAGDFLRVTQADAHAWTEIRNPSGSWIRIDPTFWIAPLRIELGGLNYFQLSPSDLKFDTGSAIEKLRMRGGNFAQLINTVQFQLDNLNFIWTRALLEFDMTEQQKLLKVLAPKIGWWITSFVFIFLLFIASKKVLFFKKTTPNQAIETFLWLQTEYEKRGFIRNPYEAPIVFLEKVKEKRRDDEKLINKTIELYRYERYRQRTSGPDDWSRLKYAWKKRLYENKS